VNKTTLNIQSLLDLESPFRDIILATKSHKYLYKSEPFKYSVSQVIKKFEPEVDFDTIAGHIANREGFLKEDILSKWDYMREYASLKGSMIHTLAEKMLYKEIGYIEQSVVIDFFKQQQITNIEKNVKDFYLAVAQDISKLSKYFKSWKDDYFILRTEFVIGDIEHLIGGTIDNLAVNKNNNLAIFDYKTNKKITKQNNYKQFFAPPLNHLSVCEYNKYCLQVNFYKYILEKYTPFFVEDMFIIWFNDDNKENVEVIEVPAMQDEIDKIVKSL